MMTSYRLGILISHTMVKKSQCESITDESARDTETAAALSVAFSRDFGWEHIAFGICERHYFTSAEDSHAISHGCTDNFQF